MSLPKTLRLQAPFLLCLLLCFLLATARAHGNSLALGTQANAESVDVPINAPGQLSFKSKADILEMRRNIVNQTPSLLASPYSPSPNVFDAIEDGRPWWGMEGSFVWGAGDLSIAGESEESRFLLNPFLLVGANSRSALIWDPDKLFDSDFADKTFPYCWLPQSIRCYPKDSLIQVSYDVTQYNNALAARRNKLKLQTVQIFSFGLIAYNARDFGYSYIYLDTGKSLNIQAKTPLACATGIRQMIHCGGSCHYPGGCNNMSPAQPEIDEFQCTQLPARANIFLWKNKPASINDKPDLTCFMDIR
jgi:hypothetical protein